MRAAQARGDARKDVAADALAARIVATIECLQMQWLLDPENVDLTESHRELAAALRRELTPPAAP